MATRMVHRPVFLLYTRPDGSTYVEQRTTWIENGLPEFVETIREGAKKDGVIVAMIEQAEYLQHLLNRRK
jgi:hypothetical protein